MKHSTNIAWPLLRVRPTLRMVFVVSPVRCQLVAAASASIWSMILELWFACRSYTLGSEWEPLVEKTHGSSLSIMKKLGTRRSKVVSDSIAMYNLGLSSRIFCFALERLGILNAQLLDDILNDMSVILLDSIQPARKHYMKHGKVVIPQVLLDSPHFQSKKHNTTAVVYSSQCSVHKSQLQCFVAVI